MENLSCKASIRRFMRQRRDQLTRYRRSEASHKSFHHLKQSAEGKSAVLSYAPMQSELCLGLLNQWLAKNDCLVLPRVDDSRLRLFRVRDLETELCISSWGIKEPHPEVCEEIEIDFIDFALIPAVAFDQDFHRLGYGRGFYDRLLSLCKPGTLSMGVGFHEQLFSPKLGWSIRPGCLPAGLV